MFVSWEASEATPSVASGSGPKASCSASSLSVLYFARRPPSVLDLSYERYISTAKLTAHRSLQALQGTTKKQNTTAKSTPANAAAVHPAVRPRVVNTQLQRITHKTAKNGRRRQAPPTEGAALDDQKKDEGPDRRHEGADGQDAETVAGPAPVVGSAPEEEGQETGISSAGAGRRAARARHGRRFSSDRTAALRHGASPITHTAAADHAIGGAHAVDAPAVRERAPTFWRGAAGVSWSAGSCTEEAVAVAFSGETAAVAVAVAREA